MLRLASLTRSAQSWDRKESTVGSHMMMLRLKLHRVHRRPGLSCGGPGCASRTDSSSSAYGLWIVGSPAYTMSGLVDHLVPRRFSQSTPLPKACLS